MKTLKNGRSLVLSLTIQKCIVHGCLLKAANVCPEGACLQTREVLKAITYKTPTKRPLWRPHWADTDKPALQANFALQTQLLLLLSSHGARLQHQLDWGKVPSRCHLLPGVAVSSVWSKSVAATRDPLASLVPHQGPQKCFLRSPTRKHSCMWDPKYFIKGFQP